METAVPSNAVFTDTDTGQRAISSSPTDGATTTSISSDWAFDNVKTAVPSGAVFTDTNTQLSAGDVQGIANKAYIDGLDVDAGTVNGKSVAVDVPSTAVFTDTNTQLTSQQVKDIANQ